LKPEAVAQLEFLEWTAADRLRHSKSVGLREEKRPRSVAKERAGNYSITSELPVTRPQCGKRLATDGTLK
jgi:ATP-dependent DNA ligase